MSCKKCEILDVLTCRTCKDYMFGGTRMCRGGHTFCERCCSTVLSWCPECGQSITGNKNLGLQKMMELFMADPTQFMQTFEGGCPECCGWQPTTPKKRKKGVTFKDEDDVFIYVLD